jgi:predicted RNase H-like nuclease
VRILGADLPRENAGNGEHEQSVVLLAEDGRVQRVEHVASLPAVAAAVSGLADGEPFLLGVNVPVVVPTKRAKARPIENLVRRRFGLRMPPGGRATLAEAPSGIAGETLIAGLAAAGQPCLPYPDRDRRRPCLAETHAGLILKSLLWQASPLASTQEQGSREQFFRAYEPPAYRPTKARSRAGSWAERAANMDLVLRALGSAEGFDLTPVREALGRAGGERDIERAAGLLDATLIAGTARRYLEAPESCLFLGDREQGYLILPADGLVRRLALSGTATPTGRLFPQTSLRERLGPHAQLRSVGLLTVPGRPQRTEASFKEPPHYEFDNLDEMLWWKHCRHLAGPSLPTEGLHELQVIVGDDPESDTPLKLQRSRHQTLSFRFEPPAAWRAHLPTRDGRVYPFRVLRAVYDTAPDAE